MPTQWKRKKIIKIENDDIKIEQIFQQILQSNDNVTYFAPLKKSKNETYKTLRKVKQFQSSL